MSIFDIFKKKNSKSRLEEEKTIDDPRNPFEYNVQKNTAWPPITDGGNFYLFQISETSGRFEFRSKSIPANGRILKPTYKEKNGDRLLDQIVLNCTSEEDYFDSIMRCVSPAGFLGEKKTFRDLKTSYLEKKTFFANLRQQLLEEQAIYTPISISVSGADYCYSIGNVLQAFNIKSVALLSLPAYAAMDYGGRAVPIAPDDPKHSEVACPLHNFLAPGRKIESFDDYFYAFTDGTFALNNSHLFIALYGLAFAIDIFVRQTDWSSCRCFEDAIDYEPLTRTLNHLVGIGALASPFDRVFSRKYHRLGIEDAQKICPELVGTLEIAEAMTPFVISPYKGPDVIQVFFGLIDRFGSTKDYFGIDRDIQFKFPAVEERPTSHDDDNGPFLRWNTFVRARDNSIGARAKILGTDEYVEFIPGKTAAPLFCYFKPVDEGWRRVQSFIWNVPETSVENGDISISVRGLKQIINCVDDNLTNEIENSIVYNENRISLVDVSKLEDLLEKEPRALTGFYKQLGINETPDQACFCPSFKPWDDDDCVGFECLAPNGFNKINWNPISSKCPTIDCLAPGRLASTYCYVWDMPGQNLVGGDGSTYRVMGAKQLCEVHCKRLATELESEAFTFYGLSAIPCESIDVAFANATGLELRESSDLPIGLRRLSR